MCVKESELRLHAYAPLAGTVTSAGLQAHESHRPHPTTGRIEMLSRKATMATHAEADLARIAGEQQLKHAAAEKGQKVAEKANSALEKVQERGKWAAIDALTQKNAARRIQRRWLAVRVLRTGS